MRNPKLTGKDQEKSEGSVSCTVRNILTKEKLKDKSTLKHVMRKCEIVKLHGQGNFEWNTDFIVTKKLENYSCQAAQDLYNGEAEHEPRGAHEEQHCRSLHETSEWIERSRTQGNLNLESGWYEW